MIELGKVFSATYGDKRYETKSRLVKSASGTPLIASGGRDNGIFGRLIIGATKQHIISVARTGSVGAAFYHGYPCEVSSDALVLTPRMPISTEAMLWFTFAINLNRHRFNYGRKVTPDRLESLRVPGPTEMGWWNRIQFSTAVDAVASEFELLDLPRDAKEESPELERTRTVEDLFRIEHGNDYELCNLVVDTNGVNFVSRTMRNNGVSAKVRRTDKSPFPAGALTVALNGNGILETCVQPAEFYTSFHVAVLTPKKVMSLEEKLYCCAAIKQHKFRYSFGRQANRTIASLTIPAKPEWVSRHKMKEAQIEIASKVRSLFANPS